MKVFSPPGRLRVPWDPLGFLQALGTLPATETQKKPENESFCSLGHQTLDARPPNRQTLDAGRQTPDRQIASPLDAEATDPLEL